MAATSEPTPAGSRNSTLQALRAIDGLGVREGVELRHYTRFAIGGEADIFAETSIPEAFVAAVRACREHGFPYYVLGDGSNVIVSDQGYRGLILRFVASTIRKEGQTVVADAGASLQSLVDFTIEAALQGLETLAGIPGSAGAAIYGNAGAYGHSISERVEWVEFFDGADIRRIDHGACEFGYRESVFKRHKEWMIFRAGMAFDRGDVVTLRRTADDITAVRDEKFPRTLRCAGSIFKNLHLKDLPPRVGAAVPERVVREGKVASAYFLEQVGAKGMQRGGIAIATYHANLIYNMGEGTATELRALIQELKQRVRERFGFEVEEEVQYVGDF